MPELELIFLGSGTSAGVPMIGCHCDVCRSDDPRDKRTRCSVVIRYNNTQVLIDTTPELRLQAIANQIDRIDAIVYTHAHADHIMGLDDCRRFNALRNGPLDVFADAATHTTLRQCFGYAFQEPKPEWRVFRPHLVPRVIEGPFEIDAVRWTPIPLMHGEMPILGFRVGRLAYCTDTNFIPDSSYTLLEDLDILILDGLQWKTHATHFSLDEAITAARRIGAKHTWFTHMSHGVRHALDDPKLPDTMHLSHDGLHLTARL